MLILCRWHVSANSLNINVSMDLQQNGVSVMTVPGVYRTDSGGRYRAYEWMARVTLSNPLTTIRSVVTPSSGTANFQDGSIFVLKLSDLGTENTDWYWNDNTTSANHTTSMVDRASVTWTPASAGLDWIAFACHAVDFANTTVQVEAQMLLDGSVQGGLTSLRTPNTVEEWVGTQWDYMPSLGASSHTVKVQTRDSAVSGTPNVYRRSSVLVFKANRFQSFADEASTQNNLTADTNVQVATVTNSLTGTTDILIWGQAVYDISSFQPGFLWVRQNGSTVIDPASDSSGFGSSFIHNAVDQMVIPWLGMLTSQSGTLDLDLFSRVATVSTGNVLEPRLLVLGMSGGSGVGGARSSAAVSMG